MSRPDISACSNSTASLRLISARSRLERIRSSSSPYDSKAAWPPCLMFARQKSWSSRRPKRFPFLLGNKPESIPRGQSLRQQQLLPAVPAGLPSSLLERRPDIRATENNLEAQHALVYAAKAAYFPRISLTGFLG